MTSYRPLLPDLMDLYVEEGYSISTGLDAKWVGKTVSEFSFLVKGGKNQTHHLGIALKEVYFLEVLFSAYRPGNLLVIGNSFGWSTFACAMLNPGVPAVAMEIGGDDFTRSWIDATNAIATRKGLAVRAVRAASPRDTNAVVSDHLGGRIDFALIDGDHTEKQVRADVEGLLPFCHDDSVLLFHDVLQYRLLGEVQRLAAEHGFAGRLFLSTTSGMAALWRNPPAGADRLAAAFGGADITQMAMAPTA